MIRARLAALFSAAAADLDTAIGACNGDETPLFVLHDRGLAARGDGLFVTSGAGKTLVFSLKADAEIMAPGPQRDNYLVRLT